LEEKRSITLKIAEKIKNEVMKREKDGL